MPKDQLTTPVMFLPGQRVTLKPEFHCYVTKDIDNLLVLPFVTVQTVQQENKTFTYKECPVVQGKVAQISMEAFDVYRVFDKPWAELPAEEQQGFLKAIIEALFTTPDIIQKIATLIQYIPKEDE